MITLSLIQVHSLTHSLAHLGDRSRGYTSKIAVIVLFDGELDIPLDYMVLSKFCHECTSWNARHQKGDVSDEQYETWRSGHAPKCSADFEGRFFISYTRQYCNRLLVQH